MMSYLELAQAYAKACRERDMALSQLADIGAGYAEKMDDFERVVRCKDCKHSYGDILVDSILWCRYGRDSVNATDFCSYGERKDKG